MELTVVSFNIRCCNDPDGYSIAERAPRLQQVLEPIGSDVICFQEYRPVWEEEIKARFLTEYDSYFSFRSKEKPEGVATLWRKDRFRCIKREMFWFSDTPNVESLGWDEKYQVPRIFSACFLQCLKTQKIFVILNTHFGFGDVCQVKSARILEQFFQKHQSIPTVLCGDFNMRSDSLGYRVITNFANDVNALTAKDSRGTYHGYHPELHPRAQIDYCFLSEQITAKGYRLIDDTVDGYYPSDHFGIEIKLDL